MIATTPAVPEVWNGLASLLQLTPKERRQLWRALVTSRDPSVRAFVYRLVQFEAQLSGEWAPQARWQFLSQTWSPKPLIQAIEQCVDEGLAARALANKAQAAVLKWTNAHGQWEWGPRDRVPPAAPHADAKKPKSPPGGAVGPQ